MRALGHRMLDEAIDYIKNSLERPVWKHAPPDVKAHFSSQPPASPQNADEVYLEYLTTILPHQLSNDHPRYWGWVTGCGTVMSMFADMLASGTDAVSGSFSYLINNYVEMQVIGWCRDLLGFPKTASGLLTSGCSASTLIGLAVA